MLHEFPKLGKGGVLMETFRRCDADLVGVRRRRRCDAARRAGPHDARRRPTPTASSPAAGCRRRSRRAPGAAAARSTSRGFAWGVRRLFRLPYADTQCGAKVIHRRVAERVVPLMSSRDFLFDVDLLIVARRLGFDVVEVPTVWLDQAGLEAAAPAAMRRGC